MSATSRLGNLELVDDHHGIVLRRVVVGALDTNCWALHAVGSRTALLVDPGDEPMTVLDAIDDLDVAAVILTHTHWDHVLGLPAVADSLGAPVLMHPHDSPVWPGELEHLRVHGHFDAGTATGELLTCGCHLGLAPGADPWDGVAHQLVHHGSRLTIGPLSVELRHTPGHTPGGLSIVMPGHVLSGDTLFPGGPGLTGWPFSDFPTIISSIERELFTLPPQTAVHPGHGRDTTIGAEAPHLAEWVQRGW